MIRGVDPQRASFDPMSMHKLLCSAVLVAAGCGGPSTTAGGPRNQAPPPNVGAPPTVTWASENNEMGDYGEFQTAGLPAVAFDGSRVVYADEEQAAGLTSPNLTLHQRGRDDREVDTQVVLAMDPDGDESAHPTEAQVDAGNQWLARSNQQFGWTPLTATPAAPVGDDEDAEPWSSPGEATSGAIVVHFEPEAHLVVRDGGKIVVDATESSWLAPSQDMGDGTSCDNPAYLSQAYIDAAHHLALVEISYYGTDSCWEPAPQLHTVAW
jgi:hypothetical protein